MTQASPVLPDSLAEPGLLDRQDRRETQDPWEVKVFKVFRVLVAIKDPRVQLDSLVNKVMLVNQDNKEDVG